MRDYKRVTKDGVTPVIEIAHQMIGGIHLLFYDEKGYEKFKAVWDGQTLWVKEGGLQIDTGNTPKIKWDEYS